jgi:hypothetical protein
MRVMCGMGREVGGKKALGRPSLKCVCVCVCVCVCARVCVRELESRNSAQPGTGPDKNYEFSECLDKVNGYQFLKKIFALWSDESVSRLISSFVSMYQ